MPDILARGSALGLDVLGFYVVGRGGVLGDVEWQVVHSSFGYFDPETIRHAWNAGKEKVSPHDVGRAFLECCQDCGRAKLATVEGLGAFCEAAEAVNEAARVPALALHAAISAKPLPADLPARAMQIVSVLREFRGGAHLLAVAASGLTPKEAHYLKCPAVHDVPQIELVESHWRNYADSTVTGSAAGRPDFWSLFGWTDADVPDVGEEHRRRLAEAEMLTDQIVMPAFSVLDEEGAAALISGVQAITAAVKL